MLAAVNYYTSMTRSRMVEVLLQKVLKSESFCNTVTTGAAGDRSIDRGHALEKSDPVTIDFLLESVVVCGFQVVARNGSAESLDMI